MMYYNTSYALIGRENRKTFEEKMATRDPKTIKAYQKHSTRLKLG